MRGVIRRVLAYLRLRGDRLRLRRPDPEELRAHAGTLHTNSLLGTSASVAESFTTTSAYATHDEVVERLSGSGLHGGGGVGGQAVQGGWVGVLRQAEKAESAAARTATQYLDRSGDSDVVERAYCR